MTGFSFHVALFQLSTCDRFDMEALRLILLFLQLTINLSAFSIDGLLHVNNFAGIIVSRRRSPVLYMNVNKSKLIYGISQSGWKSPKWNWGSAIGTGHDCAKICRQNYANRVVRNELISNLINAQGTEEDFPSDFEEVKLTLALAWQRGRWDGSDGGKGGYGEVLEYLVRADRYENGSEIEWSKCWVNDLASRFHLLKPSVDHISRMESLLHKSSLITEDHDREISVVYRARRRCSGLVLQEMGFIENGC